MTLQLTNYILSSINDTQQQQTKYIFLVKKRKGLTYFGFSLFLLAETSSPALENNLSDGTECINTSFPTERA